MTLSERIKHRAYDLGFDLIGVAPAGRALRADAYAHWVEAGHAGGMAYMTREPQRRRDVRHVMPGARSVVVVGLSHYTIDLPDEVKRDPSRGLIARYAWGLDYHDVMTPRLRDLLPSSALKPGATFKPECTSTPGLCWNATSPSRPASASPARTPA
jgi:epoxyqueuosine reductase